MSAKEKKAFLDRVKVIYDTREQKNKHILAAFDKYGVPHEEMKLDYGDYSFVIDGKDFRQTCVVERKANIDELYGNVTVGRERFEKEIATASVLSGSFTLLIENCKDEKFLRSFCLKDHDFMQSPKRIVADIGEKVYPVLRSWEQRYRFHVRYVPDKKDTASEILEIFYWYWHGYKKLTAPLGRRNR